MFNIMDSTYAVAFQLSNWWHYPFFFQLALNVLSHIAYRRGKILFVSAHPQFEELTQCTARDCGEYFITRRWQGGTFANSYMLLGATQLVDLIVFFAPAIIRKKYSSSDRSGSVKYSNYRYS